MKKVYLIPLLGFMVLVALLGFGLTNDPKEVPSPFIGKPAPQFELPRLYQQGKTISNQDMLGKVWVLNVFASWCVSCRAEHALLTDVINHEKIETVGLNYKDYGTEDYGKDVLQWLAQLGNPYAAIAVDTVGNVGIDWGVYGVPETFVIDKKGIIRHKFTGPLTVSSVTETLVPLIRSLREES